MKTKFTKEELFAIEMLSFKEEGETAQNLNRKIRKGLGLSLPLAEDGSVANVTRNILREVLNAKGKEEIAVNGKWLNFVARHVKKFLQGNGFHADETLVKLLGSGNAKEFYAHYPTAKYYEELCAAIQTWLTEPVPPMRINPLDVVLSTMLIIFRFIDGKFGKMVLKPKFRLPWRIVMYSLTIMVLWKLVICPFYEFWDKVVGFANAVIWGI